MKPPRFGYHAPRTLEEALELLASQPNARPLAGGQSLMPMLNFRLAAPDHLIDLNRISALSYIKEEAGNLVIGAMTRQRDIEKSELIAKRLPLLAEAIRLVGHRQTRNRGTLGGSLAHLDPSAELPTVAMALDAQIEIKSKGKNRVVPMADFCKGLMSTALEPDELLAEVRFPLWKEGHGHAFIEFARRHGDFAVVSCAVLLEITKGKVARASITLGGVAAAPLRMPDAEALLVDRKSIPAAAALCAKIEAFDDPTYPSWYRKKLAATLARRALEQAFERAAP